MRLPLHVHLAYGLLLTSLAHSRDPYEVLGVDRNAPIDHIRKEYRRLVKEWHPDKSNDPEAEGKFVEITQAYNLLSDPDRRKKYDEQGVTEETQYQDYSQYSNHVFEDIFSHFQGNDIAFFHKLSITSKKYEEVIVPATAHTPYIIFAYADWCFACIQTVPYARKLKDTLEPLGIKFVTIHADREQKLWRRLNMHTVPCLAVVIDSVSYPYKETITNNPKIIEFLRRRFPYKLVPKVDENSLEEFLSGWEDNRVRGLIFEPRNTTRLRYLVTAFHFRHRVAFGFVNSPAIRKKYQISSHHDTILLFNENISSPIASLSMPQIPTTTLHHVISANQYLALPRLSSQSIFESLCPVERKKPTRKRLCVVLVTKRSTDFDAHRESFRQYAQLSQYKNQEQRVRLTYIYHDRQSEFVNSLIPSGMEVEPLARIVVIWRRDSSYVNYEWLGKWEADNLTQNIAKLESSIDRILKSSQELAYDAIVKSLFDEHAKSLLSRIFSKFMLFTESVYDGLGKEQILPVLSIVGSIAFILIIGYVMAYLVRVEEENIKKQKAGNNNNDKSEKYQPELKLHELRAEKYNGLVRLLKPGCRTIILVLDMQSRQELIPPFHKAVWPYRKNKTLMFAYMYVERGLSWYKELLELSLMEERELNINPRNCVGTVLSLNGHRKYFCMFHAKHSEMNRRKHSSNNVKKEKDLEAAAFLGFDTSSESDEEVLLQGNLLDGLPNWLDRLFEGTSHRYHINYWPEFPNK